MNLENWLQMNSTPIGRTSLRAQQNLMVSVNKFCQSFKSRQIRQIGLCRCLSKCKDWLFKVTHTDLNICLVTAGLTTVLNKPLVINCIAIGLCLVFWFLLQSGLSSWGQWRIFLKGQSTMNSYLMPMMNSSQRPMIHSSPKPIIYSFWKSIYLQSHWCFPLQNHSICFSSQKQVVHPSLWSLTQKPTTFFTNAWNAFLSLIRNYCLLSQPPDVWKHCNTQLRMSF